MELTTPSCTLITDDYRAPQLTAINAAAEDLNH